MTAHDLHNGALEAATPLDVYRAVSSYELQNVAASSTLGITAELFDEDALCIDVELFVEESRRGKAVYSNLGLFTAEDGINVNGLADLYERRGRNVWESDHEAVVGRVMGGGHLAVAVSRTALRGISVEYLRHRHEWEDQDLARRRAIGWASINPAIYWRNNVGQRRGSA